MENKCVKFYENSFNRVEAVAMSEFFIVLKGGNLIKTHYKVISLGQSVALLMVNKFVKFDENSFHFVKVMAEIC